MGSMGASLFSLEYCNHKVDQFFETTISGLDNKKLLRASQYLLL